MALFDKSLGATSLDDFDFTKIKEHLEKQREEKKNRPIDERKKEIAEKAEQDAKYFPNGSNAKPLTVFE